MVGVEEGWVSVCWQRGWQSRVSKGKLGRTGRIGCADVKELVVCSLEEPVRPCECAVRALRSCSPICTSLPLHPASIQKLV
jgi:hypothetical protein